MRSIVSIFPAGVVNNISGPVSALVVSSLPAGVYSNLITDGVFIRPISGLHVSAVTLYCLKRDSGNLRLRFSISVVDLSASPSPPITETESAYADYVLTGNNGDISMLSLASPVFSPFSGIEQNDILGIQIERDGANSGDDYANDFDIARIDFVLESAAITYLRLPPFRHRMRASDFRCRAVLQEQLLTSDGAGGNIPNWDDIASFWVDIKPMSLYEINQAALVGTVVDTKILMRDAGDLTLKLSATGTVSRLLRFVYGTHSYKIAGILDHGDIVEVVCSEIQPID